MAFPDLDAVLNTWFGPGIDYGSRYTEVFANAANLITQANPPYTLQDFVGFFPRFLGVAASLPTTTTLGSATVEVQGDAGLAAGQLVSGAGIPGGAVTQTVTANAGVTPATSTVLLSAPATASISAVNCLYFENPRVPLIVLQNFLALANASLSIQRYGAQQWQYVMALYIAHFAQLYIQSEGDASSPAGIAAATGLSPGLITSMSAGGVSVSVQPLSGLESWAAWTLTSYGTQLATIAKSAGALSVMYIL